MAHKESGFPSRLISPLWAFMLMKKLFILSLILSLFLPGAAFATIDSSLKYGMRNTEVSELQEYLIDKGFLSGAATNFFGPLTLKAVKTYQASVALPTTGFVGPQTRAKINTELSVYKDEADQAEIAEVGAATVITSCSNGAVFNSITGARCSNVVTNPQSEEARLRQIQINQGVENDRRVFELAEQKRIRDAEALESARLNAENAKILEIRAVENQIFERNKKYIEDRQALTTQSMSSNQYNTAFAALQSRYQLDIDILELKLAELKR